VWFDLGRKGFGSKIVNCEFTCWSGNQLAFLLHLYHLFFISFVAILLRFYHFLSSLCRLFVTLLLIVLGICQRFLIWDFEIWFVFLRIWDWDLGFYNQDLRFWHLDIEILFGICPPLHISPPTALLQSVLVRALIATRERDVLSWRHPRFNDVNELCVAVKLIFSANN